METRIAELRYKVRRFGEDIILVEQEPQPRALRRRR